MRWFYLALTCCCLAAASFCPAAQDITQRTVHTPPIDVPAVRQAHPRLVFRGEGSPGPGRTFNDLRRLYRTDRFFQETFREAFKACEEPSHPAMAAACWIVSGEDRYAAAAARLLDEAKITESGSGSYSNVWSFALAWDWLYDHPALSRGVRERSAARIAERLKRELAQLDDTVMALWHGRNQAANGAMVAALALAGLPGQKQNLSRAAGHFAASLRALDFSEGWPEGPSYWIYNRALPYALAVDCFMTATGVESLDGIGVHGVMRKIGLWTLYSFGPNGIFEPYGDSARSLRLGETGIWEASADYFARLSRDPGVAAGSDYLRSRSPAPYGKRPVHWYAALAYDPSARPRGGYDPRRPELWLRVNMPQSMLFGRDTLGVAFMRGVWGDPNELFVSFKVGDMLAHHDHYQVGHFSIQMGGLLAPLTGIYGGTPYTGAYRLGYAIQTVASNSLLILTPGETSQALFAQPNRPWTALSGGQRVINPTGFDCLHVEDFKRLLNAGRHLERATIKAFESIPGKLDYIAADITAAYNSTFYAEPGAAAKVSRVTRQFVYLRREKAFVVFDRVETIRPEYTPKFLLHSLAKPRTASERLIAGPSADDGILETGDRKIQIETERGVLTQIILLPEKARTLKIGGPNYSGYVEADGDQRNGFNGTNLDPGPDKDTTSAKPKGLWRVEVEPEGEGTSHRFLNVLLPRLAADRSANPEVQMLEAGENAVAVKVGGSAVVFSRDGGRLEQVELSTRAALATWIVD
ncbi:MAG: hypothetical protein WCE62_10190, partial [Polyangiales bacterium]